MNKLQIGDTVFYRNINDNILSKTQHWVLGTDLSHSSFIAGLFDDSVIELDADLKVRIHTFLRHWFDEIDTTHRQIFRYNPEFIDQQIVEEVIRELRYEYEDKLYGFVQWPAIAIRTLFERLGFKDAKKWDILWGWGVVCSELLYYGEKEIAMRSFAKNKKNILQEYLYELYQFNPDTFTPKDLREIYYKFPMIKKEMIWH